MKLVIGAPVKDRAWILPLWLESVHSQFASAGLEPHIVCLYSESSDETLELLTGAGVEVIYDDEPGRSTSEIEGHNWGHFETYDYMSRIRNRLTDHVRNSGADLFLSLDTDIILPPGGLSELVEYSSTHPGVVSPAVNMSWQAVAWNVMNWTQPDFHLSAAYRAPGVPSEGHVEILMAAMLLDRVAMTVCEWRPHVQGEDVGFGQSAREHGVDLWWVPSISCDHHMIRF